MGSLRNKAMRPVAILSRLVAMLALAFFAVPLGPSDRAVARAGPTAESRIDQSHGIVSMQRHLPRAEMSGADAPDHAEPIAALPAPPAIVALLLAAAESATLLPVTLRILPPVRGPPEV